MTQVATTAKAEPTTAPQLVSIPQSWQNRLCELAEARGKEGRRLLAQLVVDQLSLRLILEDETTQAALVEAVLTTIGCRFLTEVQAKEEVSPLLTKLSVVVKPPLAVSTRPAPAAAPALAAARRQVALPYSQAEQPPPPRPYYLSDAGLKEYDQLVMAWSGIRTRTKAGAWFPVTYENFQTAVAAITRGKTPEEMAEILGVEQLSKEARQRYSLSSNTFTKEQIWAAALHIVAEWEKDRRAALPLDFEESSTHDVEERQEQTLHGKAPGTASSGQTGSRL